MKFIKLLQLRFPCNGWCLFLFFQLFFFAFFLCLEISRKSRLYLFVFSRLLVITIRSEKNRRKEKKITTTITIIKSYIWKTTSEFLSWNSIVMATRDMIFRFLSHFFPLFSIYLDVSRKRSEVTTNWCCSVFILPRSPLSVLFCCCFYVSHNVLSFDVVKVKQE